MATLIPLLREFEQNLLEQNTDLTKNSIIIGIGGLSGVGKDEMSKGIANFLKSKYNLEIEILGAGSVMRKLAKEEGYDQADLDRFLQKIAIDSQYAREIDIKVEEGTLEIALSGKNIIIHGRMTPFSIGTWGIGIWLTADPRIIAERISKDIRRPECGLSIDEIYTKNVRRDLADMSRLEQMYEIDIKKKREELDINFDTSNYSIEHSISFLSNRVEEILKQKSIIG